MGSESISSPGHQPLETNEQPINIRNKPTKVPTSPLNPLSAEMAIENVREAGKMASSIQMKPIETVPKEQYELPEPLARSPAPLPEATSPAGVPIDLDVDAKNAVSKGLASPHSEGDDFKINLDEMDDLDLTISGKEGLEYRRNVKGTVVVAILLLLSLHLFLEHLNMFSWIVKFNSTSTVLAMIFYVVSSFMMLFTFMCALVKPSFSTQDENLDKYYSTILVAAAFDLIAIVLGGGIFGPLLMYSQDTSTYANYNYWAFFMSLLINGSFYFAFTRKSDSAVFGFLHPFEPIKNESEEESTEDSEKVDVESGL